MSISICFFIIYILRKYTIYFSNPVATWKNTFIPTETGTMVICFARYPNAQSLETVIKMGMSEGLTMAHDQLENVLAKLVYG
jgi:hypothetical protein